MHVCACTVQRLYHCYLWNCSFLTVIEDCLYYRQQNVSGTYTNGLIGCRITGHNTSFGHISDMTVGRCCTAHTHTHTHTHTNTYIYQLTMFFCINFICCDNCIANISNHDIDDLFIAGSIPTSSWRVVVTCIHC